MGSGGPICVEERGSRRKEGYRGGEGGAEIKHDAKFEMPDVSVRSVK